MARYKMMVVVLYCCIMVLLSEDDNKPTDEEVESVFGVTVAELRNLVKKQFFVSSCQYGIIKKLRMYENAKDQCENQLTNGRIAVIRDAKENAVVNNLFLATYGHGLDNNFMSNNPYNFIWIGLERETDGSWMWDDNTPLNYTNWKKNHPKGQNSYVRMNKNGYWDSTSNINHHPVLCEHTGKYVIFKKKMTFIEASDVCQKMSMSLAMSTDSQENEDLMKSAGYSLGSPSLESKMFEEENTWIWIAGNEGKDGGLYWSNGDTIDYTNFEELYGAEIVGNETGQFNGTEQSDETMTYTGNGRLILSKKDGTWKLLDKNEKRSFACQCSNPGRDDIIAPKSGQAEEKDEDDIVIESVVGACKRRFYIYLDQMSYPEAAVECRKKGLVLAKVESQEENEYVLAATNRAYNGEFSKRLYNDMNWYWLGGSDDMMEGMFEWEDGTMLNYTNWGRGQPDNAHALRGGQSKISVYRGTGLWDDSHAYRKRPFVCFDEFVTLEQELGNDCDGLNPDTTEDVEETQFGGNVEGMDEKDDDTDKTDTDKIEDGTEEIDEEDEADEKVYPTEAIVIPKEVSAEEPKTRDECLEWEYQGNYHIPTVTKTFADAKVYCEERDMSLASVYSESDNARLRNLILNRVPVSGYVLATEGELSWYWVGLQLDEDSNEPKWIHGNGTIFEKFAPRNRNLYDKEAGKTVVGVSKLDGSWEWRSRDNKYMFVCESNAWKCSMTRAINVNETCLGYWQAKRVYTYYMDYLLINESQAICKENGGRIAFPGDMDENSVIRAFAEERYPLPANIKANAMARENWIWLDVNDFESEGSYKHNDGSNVTWFNWGVGQPDNKYPKRGGQNAVAMNKNTGKWFDVFHNQRIFQFVCQKDVAQCVVRGRDTAGNDVNPTGTVGPAENDVSAPKFIIPPSSYIAEVGSTITMVATWEPADALVEWVHNGQICTDGPNSGKRKYVTTDKKFVVKDIVADDAGLFSCILTSAAGKKAIVTVAITIADKTPFVYIQGAVTRELAQSACVSLGGGLACPKTLEQTEEILELHSGLVWLGINDDDADDVWTSHESIPLTYTNWDEGEPLNKSNGKQGVVMSGLKGGDSYGKWIVKEASSKASAICERVPVKVKGSSNSNVDTEGAR